jgi:glycosyltransferase involved in cell wall biosynthesis
MRNMAAGGAEVFLLSLLRNLNRLNFSPEVLSIYGGGVLQKEFEDIGVPTHVMHFRGLADSLSYLRLYKLMRARRYEIVHTKLFHADFVGRVCGRLAGVPAIFSSIENVHDWTKEHTLRQSLKELVCRSTARVNHRIIAVSDMIRDALVHRIGIAPERIEVIHNSVDVNIFDPQTVQGSLKQELGLSDRDNLVGIIGTLNKNKNQKTLIEAAKHILTKNRNVHFILAGRGEQKDLRGLSEQLGIAAQIHFLGARRDIPQVLKSLDIYVMTSFSEGISISLLEAMAMKRGVIATRVGGNPEIISSDEFGVLVPPNRPDILAMEVSDLLGQPDRLLQLGENARKRVMEEFNLVSTVARYEQLYRTAVAK